MESLRESFRGALVEKGQPILTLYSPTLLATQEDYLRANLDDRKKDTGNQLPHCLIGVPNQIRGVSANVDGVRQAKVTFHQAN